jgi:DNA-binding transcriptional regulator YhcF (GntR family)
MSLVTHTNGNGAARKFNTEPLYIQVMTAVRERIANHDWKPGDNIPNEGDLAREYQVSSGTMRKALDALEAEGLLIRKQGRGTHVRERASWGETANECAALLTHLGSFRPAIDPKTRALVAIDAEGEPLMEDGPGGKRVHIVRTAADFRLLAESATALAGWLELRALAPSAEGLALLAEAMKPKTKRTAAAKEAA